MLRNSYIIEAKRSPIGKFGGSLSSSPITLVTSHLIMNVLNSLPKFYKNVDEIILGNVLSSGLGQNPSRNVVYNSRLSIDIPAYTINKVCGSGLKSVILASQSIQNNEADLIIAGGMENMSLSPHLLHNYRYGKKLGDQIIIDSMLNDGLICSLTHQHMGLTAENIATKFEISREEQDLYSLKSHQKAIRAIDNQLFLNEIMPVKLPGLAPFCKDEQPRRDTNITKLSKLKAMFSKNGTITAGNSSSINDGVAILFVSSEKFIKKHKIKPLAQIISYQSVALDPNYMGLGAYYAINRLLKNSNIKKSNINLWEINEAFASQIITVIKLLNIDSKIVNVNGGAIALGHPIGASGARILITLIYELKRRKLQYGIAALCIGGGQGIAMLVKNI